MVKFGEAERVIPVISPSGENQTLLAYLPNRLASKGDNVIVPNAPLFTEAERQDIADRAEARERINRRLSRLSLAELKSIERQMDETLISDGEKD